MIHHKLLNQKLQKWDKVHGWDLDTCCFSEVYRYLLLKAMGRKKK